MTPVRYNKLLFLANHQPQRFPPDATVLEVRDITLEALDHNLYPTSNIFNFLCFDAFYYLPYIHMIF